MVNDTVILQELPLPIEDVVSNRRHIVVVEDLHVLERDRVVIVAL